MLKNLSARVTSVLSVNTSKYRLQRIGRPRSVIGVKAKIRDDLKAGGTLQGKFTVSLTSEGIKVDITV